MKKDIETIAAALDDLRKRVGQLEKDQEYWKALLNRSQDTDVDASICLEHTVSPWTLSSRQIKKLNISNVINIIIFLAQ